MCDTPDFYQERTVRARKAHTCVECPRTIQPGDSYQRVSGKWDGEVETFRTCARCVRLRELFQERRADYIDTCGVLLGELRAMIRSARADDIIYRSRRRREGVVLDGSAT